MSETVWRRRGMVPVVSFAVLLAALGPGPARAAEAPEPDGLAFLEPLMGPWVPHPDWPPLAKDPRLRTLVPLNLHWGPGRSFMTISEGLLVDGGYDATGVLVWNPATRRAEFLAKQIGGDLVFDGHYEPLDGSDIRRVYDVIRPDGTIDVYRETFHFGEGGVLDWTTERMNDGGRFEPVSGKPGPEAHQVRPPAEAGAAAIVDLAPLIGEWRPDPKRMPAGLVAWRKSNGVDDGYASFAWGTGRAWIEFGEHRKQGGSWRLEGSGLIAWDPARRLVVYREHSDSGVALEGSVVRLGPSVVKRYYRAAHPDGSVEHWEDTWRWQESDPDCFEWTTARVEGATKTPREPYWVCRRKAAAAAHP